ncbi:DUF2637 domain-containing protein [Actinomadura fulvescens]
MAAAVLTATAGGFAQSYAGLYHWALEHGLSGWKAESFPLLVDLFIIVGELGLFLLAIDAFVLHRRRFLSWLDFGLPLSIALAGWTASLIFNVGHVGERAFSYQATAAVPPIVSMLGLFVLLRTLHRYVADEDGDAEPKRDTPDIRAVALHQVTLTPIRNTGPFLQVRARPEPALEPGTSRPDQNGATEASTPEEPTGPAATASTATTAAPAAAPEKITPTAESAPARPVNGTGAAVLAPSVVMSSTNGTPDVAAPQVDQDALRGVVIESLERHDGDVPSTLAEVTGKGYRCDEADVRRISANHWFPYTVYRLLARHDGDGDLVAGVLAERGVDFDKAALDELVRSWRV